MAMLIINNLLIIAKITKWYKIFLFPLNLPRYQ